MPDLAVMYNSPHLAKVTAPIPFHQVHTYNLRKRVHREKH